MRFKVRRRVLPPPPREFLYLERDGENAYYVHEAAKGEPKGKLTAAEVLSAFAPLDAAAAEQLEADAKQEAPAPEAPPPAEEGPDAA